nr:AAA family ATPase [Thermoanaerobacter wiegelii]
MLVNTRSNPDSNIYPLDGKDFQEISSFIKKLFFEKKKKEIWHEPLNENETIESLIEKQLNAYEIEINKNVNEGNITKKIKEFLPSLTEIVINSEFKLQDINIDVKVKFLENDKEILVDKKGDGTKRRITMALLDYKNEIESENEMGNSIYLFDEPDTHLHVRAQKDLMNIIQKFSKTGKQVIITTHSPFIINSCKPQQIRLLTNTNNTSTVKFIKKDKEIDRLLRNIGIENTYLFFAKKILIVEGETEEKFIPIIFERLFNSNLYSNLIKIINVIGIKNVPGFARALLELINKDNIYMLVDNDIQETTSNLITQLDLDEEHIFKIGNKEFEDSFQASTIYRCWKKYVEERDKKTGNMWDEKNIEKLKYECILNGEKFSKKIRELNKGCTIRLNKISLGIALGEYCEEDELDINLRELLYKLKN